jgi:hypothetical protein
MRRSQCIVLYLSYSSPILPYSTTKIPFCKEFLSFFYFLFYTKILCFALQFLRKICDFVAKPLRLAQPPRARVTRVALSNRKRLQPFYFYSLPTSTPLLGVWLASISIRFWMIGDAKRLRIEVSHARSFPLSISPKDIESEGNIPPVR